MDKILLDNIIEKHKVQPVGWGYIDLLVSRDNYEAFISDLVINGFKIDSVSWWEWCEQKNENKYGLGGPESLFHDGWFAEIPVTVDEFDFLEESTSEHIIKVVLGKIEAKTISFSGEIAKFSNSKWMTPAIWLDVPNEWRNKHNT
jgi:hypothetical protein